MISREDYLNQLIQFKDTDFIKSKFIRFRSRNFYNRKMQMAVQGWSINSIRNMKNMVAFQVWSWQMNR